MIAENRHNEWANNGKALNLFQLTEALVFFGTPFGGTDEWYQKYLPGLANDLVSHVDNGIFETFRRGNDNLNELKKNILDKLHSYKKPNVGCFHELQVSNVGKIVGDEKITKVGLQISYLPITGLRVDLLHIGSTCSERGCNFSGRSVFRRTSILESSS